MYKPGDLVCISDHKNFKGILIKTHGRFYNVYWFERMKVMPCMEQDMMKVYLEKAIINERNL